MKKFAVSVMAILCIATALAQNPKLVNYTNDYGGVMTPPEREKLNSDLKKYQDSTSTQIFVLTLPEYDDQKNGPLFDFSIKVFKEWKIGQEGINNGVLLVVVKNLASKHAPGLRIVTGKGTEGALTDLTCGRIIEEHIRPLVNAGQYYAGIDSGKVHIEKALAGEFSATPHSLHINWTIVILVIVLLIIFIIIAARYGAFEDDGFLYFLVPDGGSFGDGGGDGGGSFFDGGGFDGGGGGDSGGGGAGD